MKINFVNKLRSLLTELSRLKDQNQDLRLLVGTMLSRDIEKRDSIEDAEFKVFSQFGDDGIIQYIIKKIPIINKVFVEFGVETYQESNTRFLLINNNWHGLIIDGSDVNIEYIKKDSIYWRHNLTALSSFITAENINQIFVDSGFRDRVGLLSIDIDGNDYWVWKAITAIEPSIVVVEYNSLFGNDRAITVPYRPDFKRRTAHYSNLFLGASLPALYDLAVEKGYAFAGCNRAGNNAYFIRNEFTEFFKSKTLSEGYVQAQFRESLTESGELSFLSFDECKKLIRNLLVFNVKTQEEEPF